MADQKQLILVVEATAAMGPYWQTIVTDYLDKIIRCFCGNESATQRSSVPVVELALVTFNTHESISVVKTQADMINDALLSLSFNDAAIAEGLGEALMMLPSPNGSQAQQNADIQRHCILIASSNPYPLPTPVYRPQNLMSEQSEPHSRLSDAETVAKSFSQCSISLSVICPKQLPKLRAIYNAGKRSPHAADPPIDNVKTLDHLVLISENFMEALAALSRTGMTNSLLNQTRVKMEVSSVPPVSVPPPTSIPSVNGSLINRLPISVCSIAPATVKVEPSTVSSMVSAPAFQHFPHVQDLKPMVNGMTRPIGTSSGYGAMMPTPGLSQQVQPAMQSLSLNNNAAANVPLSLQTSSAPKSAQSKYVKIWEGNLYGQRRGQAVFITVLEGYRRTSASETLAANWPPTMQIVRLISQDHMNNKHYAGKVDALVFRAMYQHGFLGQLREKKLCAVIPLPSQTLLLCVSDKANRLLGTLFPGVRFQHHPPLQQQQQQQQHQQQQQQQIPQFLQQPSLLPHQQQPSQMVGTGMGQAYVQGPAGSHS